MSGDELTPEEKAARDALLVFRSGWIKAIARDPRLTGAEKTIAAAVADQYLHTGPRHPRFGLFWPSMVTLAKYVSVHEKTVRRALKSFCDFEYVQRIEGGGGSGKTAVFRPTLPKQTRTEMSMFEETKPEQNCPPNPDISVQQTRTRMSTNPYKERSLDEDLEALPSGSAARAPTRAAPQISKIPEVWEPDLAGCAYAIDRGYVSDEWFNRARDRFKNYHGTNGSKFLDWVKAWQSWVDRAEEFGPHPNSNEAGSVYAKVEAWRGKQSVPEPTESAPEPIAHELGAPGERLAALIGRSEFKAWFANVTCAGVSDRTVYLVAPSPFMRKLIRERYEDRIMACWEVDWVDIVEPPRCASGENR